jgi:hypothetical protein
MILMTAVLAGCVHGEGRTHLLDNSRFLGKQLKGSIVRYRYQALGEGERVILFDLVGTEKINDSVNKRYNIREVNEPKDSARHTVIFTVTAEGLLSVSEASYYPAVHPMLILSNPVTMTAQNVFKGRIALSEVWREVNPTGETVTHTVLSLVTPSPGEEMAVIEILAPPDKWVYSFDTRIGLVSLKTYMTDSQGATVLRSSLEQM